MARTIEAAKKLVTLSAVLVDHGLDLRRWGAKRNLSFFVAAS